MTLPDQTLARIEAMIDGADIASHPFVSAWRDGRMELEDLRSFAAQYHTHTDAFPRYISTIHSHTHDAATRRTLLDLLVAAENRTPTMSDLWLQTCAALGLSGDTVRSTLPTHATEACVNDFFYLCQSSIAGGLAALYVHVRLIPGTVRQWHEGLMEHYDLSSGPGIEFFEVAEFVASEKAQALRVALANAIDSDDAANDALGATAAALTAVKGLLSGALSVAGSRR